MDRIVIELHGSNTARSHGIEVNGRGLSGPICPLARKLVEKGLSPERLVYVYRGETLCFRPVSLSWWAAKQAREAVDSEPKFYDYSEFWVAS